MQINIDLSVLFENENFDFCFDRFLSTVIKHTHDI